MYTWGKDDNEALVGSLQHVVFRIDENLVVAGVTESCAVVDVAGVDDERWKSKHEDYKRKCSLQHEIPWFIMQYWKVYRYITKHTPKSKRGSKWRIKHKPNKMNTSFTAQETNCWPSISKPVLVSVIHEIIAVCLHQCDINILGP